MESLEELHQALEAGADIVMLDELSLEDMREAVRPAAGRAKLEASGGINDSTLRVIAETGVDYISLGTLTKDVKAVDFVDAVGLVSHRTDCRSRAPRRIAASAKSHRITKFARGGAPTISGLLKASRGICVSKA